MSIGSDVWMTPVLKDKPQGRRGPSAPSKAPEDTGFGRGAIIAEESFQAILSCEQKRMERSGKQFLLMWLEAEKLFQMMPREKALDHMLHGLSTSVRETDFTGWFRENVIIGVIFTEVGLPGETATADAILTRVVEGLRKNLSSDEVDAINVKFRIFPNEEGQSEPGHSFRQDPRQEANLATRNRPDRAARRSPFAPLPEAAGYIS